MQACDTAFPNLRSPTPISVWDDRRTNGGVHRQRGLDSRGHEATLAPGSSCSCLPSSFLIRITKCPNSDSRLIKLKASGYYTPTQFPHFSQKPAVPSLA